MDDDQDDTIMKDQSELQTPATPSPRSKSQHQVVAHIPDSHALDDAMQGEAVRTDDERSGDEDGDEDDESLKDELATQPSGKLAARFAAERPYFKKSENAVISDSEIEEVLQDDVVNGVDKGKQKARAVSKDGKLPPPPGAKRVTRIDLDDDPRDVDEGFRQPTTDSIQRHMEHSGSERVVKSETPERSTSPISQPGSSGRAVADRPKQWAGYTDLICEMNQKLGIKSQNSTMQGFLYLCIEKFVLYSFTRNAFPLIPEKTQAIFRAMKEAAQELSLEDLSSRLKADKGYARTLSAIPDTRVTLIRSHMKVAADGGDKKIENGIKISDAFTLPLNDVQACEQRVKQLLKRQYPAYDYVFPPRETTGTVYQPDHTKPYLHPWLIHVLRNCKEVGKGRAPYATRLVDHFRPSPGAKPEVPAPLLALAATAIHAALSEYSTGTHMPMRNGKKVHFDGSYSQVYMDHLDSIKDLETSDDTKAMYHPLLAKIYSSAFDTLPRAPIDRTPRDPQSAPKITVINLD
ncbi:hypothetical protein EUX98_g1492 [Antrodiella citrinella]|uniref:DUF6532 domain-containing protein n=1 Tax=Antrodiella citrinella TaxID=2447956 RepID=A0A4S4N4D3_9APHY|nr:hypothetical protein EUX98_g1492 [Antrodiella citrinella]